MKASPRTQAAVQATLQQWKDAYSQRDLDAALAVIAPDDDVVGIGTGPDEWRVGPEEFRAQLERDFVQSGALSVDYEPLVVSEAGPVAWVAGRVTVQARVEGQDLTLTGRFTAVLEQRGDRWLLVQPTSHFLRPNRPRADPSEQRPASDRSGLLYLRPRPGPQVTWTARTTTVTSGQQYPRSVGLPRWLDCPSFAYNDEVTAGLPRRLRGLARKTIITKDGPYPMVKAEPAAQPVPGSSSAAVPLACHSQRSLPVPSGQPRTTR